MAMLPSQLQIAVVERGRLHVGDVRLAFLVEVIAAGRTDPLGPPNVQHPPRHVDHVDPHVADRPVAELHVASPPAGVDILIYSRRLILRFLSSAMLKVPVLVLCFC